MYKSGKDTRQVCVAVELLSWAILRIAMELMHFENKVLRTVRGSGALIYDISVAVQCETVLGDFGLQ